MAGRVTSSFLVSDTADYETLAGAASRAACAFQNPSHNFPETREVVRRF